MKRKREDDNHISQKFAIAEAAKTLRVEIEQYILCDFKKREMIEQYGQSACDEERENISDYCRKIMDFITLANDIFIEEPLEYEVRRTLQDLAIGTCDSLGNELDFIAEMYRSKLNIDKYVRVAGKIKELKKAIRAWRSANRKLKPNKEK